MAVLGTTQMAVDIATTAIYARLLQQTVHSQVDPQLLASYRMLDMLQDLSFAVNNFVTDSFFLYRCYLIWGSKKRIVILPALFMLSTIVVGILESTPGSSITDIRIPYSLGAATNLLLTVFTAGRILWIRREARHVGLDNMFRSRYNTVLKIILESGALYCVTAIFLIIAFSLDAKVFYIALGIAPQSINIIPTFTLYYIGLTNTAENPLPDHVLRRIRPPPSLLGPVQSSELSQVLDIKPQGIEEQDVGAV
ncbi:hypothetical protein B0H19DRAFT_438876 [Mycena capillaripes]|nr:hypothetical protein B0H19DRAFT_438876 [Mycena capillaripes]